MKDVNKRFLLPLELQLFADDPEPTPQDPSADPTPEPEKTFTETEVNDIVAKRLERERKKYADYDDIKAQLTELLAAEEEREKAQMSELERAEAEKAAALKKAQEAEDARSKALESANQRLIRAEFALEAKSAGIEYVDDAFRLADLSKVTVDDDGNVLGVVDAVKTLVESKPYLIPQKAPTQPKTIGDPTPSFDTEVKTLEQQLEVARQKRDFSKVIELSNKLKNLVK